jgi:tol-pal system-associated acyl-CoA thioesterase
VFVWQSRVYWEDTDAGGIVYYANHLRFLERARSEWLRERGVSQRALALDPGIVFSVIALTLQYLRPARLDDLLAISCEPGAAAGARVEFRQRIWRDGVQGELLLEASVRIACVDALSLKPRRLPAVIVGDPARSP